tara:strand:+ start:1194 stop:1520 length:327 start_codon:yes stop_codon:yes gene_type:complete
MSSKDGMLLNYKFKKGLVKTSYLLDKLSISVSTLNYWKTLWIKNGGMHWDMGMRMIGKNAFWDPIVFCNWIVNNKLKNKPTQPEQKLDHDKMILFVKRNVEEQKYDNR